MSLSICYHTNSRYGNNPAAEGAAEGAAAHPKQRGDYDITLYMYFLQ